MTADLYLFDIDGTVIRSFLREGAGRDRYDDVELLPDRRKTIRSLVDHGARVALVTNQGGVAFGYQDPPQVCRKIAAVWDALGFTEAAWSDAFICCGPNESDYRDGEGLPRDFGPEEGLVPFAYVAFTHPTARRDRWRADDGWRKPGPGMIDQARIDFGVSRERVLFVGDMDSDAEAAKAADVSYADAGDFFGTAEAR